MTLDDLMEAWRSQEITPVHGVDKTLLLAALRQGEAKLRTRRRWEMWFANLSMAMLVGFTVMTILVMIYPDDDDVLFFWDYVVAAVAMTAALVLWGMTIRLYRAQARREKGFGDSLRDQLNRQIALIDHWAAKPTLAARVIMASAIVAAITFGFISARINEKSYAEAWPSVFGALLGSLAASGVYLVWHGRWVRRRLRPRRRRLEGLLEDLDDR